MVSIAELTERFGPPLNVAPWGECLVIKGSEFDPDWEAELGDLGFSCHFGELDRYAVTFVPLKKPVPEGKVVYVPPKALENNSVHEEAKETVKIEKKKGRRGAHPGGPSSNSEADDFIVELWKTNVTYDGITKTVKEKFPGKLICVDYRITLLKKAGRIQCRQKRIQVKTPDDNAAEAQEEYTKAANIIREKSPEATGPDLKPQFDVDAAFAGYFEMSERLKLLSDAYDALSRSRDELREDFDAYSKMTSEINEANRAEINKLNAKYAKLQKELASHKHAVSGEAMFPMEASS